RPPRVDLHPAHPILREHTPFALASGRAPRLELKNGRIWQFPSADRLASRQGHPPRVTLARNAPTRSTCGPMASIQPVKLTAACTMPFQIRCSTSTPEALACA